ncbi:MAG: hypothetical protein HC781_20070 [Leptolyngbyaceae cyanobacterium CSU_1_4]|nr:hypothetical protein [Leptolyngbyaceae cyanobacterium CSU_1_4]
MTGIRTFLNFFLQKEVQELQATNQIIQGQIDSEAQRNEALLSDDMISRRSE